MTQTQTSIEAMVQAYFDIWNEADPARRRALIGEVWAAGARYLDPMFAAEGVEQLDALVVGLHQNYPGHYFRRTGAVDSHHDRARWSWDFFNPEGGLVMSGVDFAILAADGSGKLSDVTGFFQPAA